MKSKEKAPSPIEQLLGGKKEPEKTKKKLKHKKTVIESHFGSDGQSKGHTVRHSPDSPEEVSYTAADLNGVKDGLEEHLGEPAGAEKAPTSIRELQGK
jgi:hypothetical protein